jgi:tetratricopeptide (TPR) repeat protein
MKSHGPAWLFACSATLLSTFALAQIPYSQIPTPRGVCVSNCASVYVPPPYSGPTPEELRRLREAKDSGEAAQDAEDHGVAAYEKGDFEGAARWFKEALEFAPDDDGMRANLAKAEQRARTAREAREAEQRRLAEAARNTEATRQLMSVQKHSTEAAPGGSSAQAGIGIDTGGKRAGGLPGPVYAGGAGRPTDRVVPPERRTPAIAALESQRTESKQKLKELDEKLVKLDPRKDTVEIAKVKQEKSTQEGKVNYLNFSIGEVLDKPPAVPAPGPAAR